MAFIMLLCLLLLTGCAAPEPSYRQISQEEAAALMREEPGMFPAYHMNKAHWLTIALDGSAEEGKIKFLLDMSYELTK